ncbi:CHAT domain-containing protein [Scytonema hofmannii FACHB-248]|uniref:CHAT domain-containing protein n=1 Tax=Scytonema hofmannii FACHB-248 TaxID=1842502 RepID=A0ABR8GL19_9CYAN|nr:MULTISPECIES: CHAT domain-containing tetratricopeptide repeat protein [Nostocales]MBD2604080.1 CHAT domain-containing protein [Scytonema hofmannii FACHB-248]
MNEQRLQAYLNLINQLLSCASGEEVQILNANQDLVDAGLVQKMLEVANDLRMQGNLEAANSLMNVAGRLMRVYDNTPLERLSSTSKSSPLPSLESQEGLVVLALQATQDSKGNPEFVYPLLEANLHLLDHNFAQVFQKMVTAALSNLKPEQTQANAVDVGNFSRLIFEFPLGNRANNLEIAITGYQIAAQVFNHPQTFPPNKAAMQHRLGIAYLYRILGDRAENLETAIAYFKAALAIRTREALPQEWAETQNALGVVYLERIRGEKAENLEAALACFQEALTVRTPETFPRQWAETQNNLGIVYRNRIRGRRVENIEAAIAHFQAALTKRTRETSPQDWAETQTNLGNVYIDRIRGEKAENSEAAIRCFQAALDVETRHSLRVATLINLGIAYNERLKEDKAENLETAIRCFQAALEGDTYNVLPQEWLAAQINLGNAYRDRIRGEKAENLATAIHCFQRALEVCSREVFPQRYAEIQYGLGLVYQFTQQFDSAHTAFAAAIDTVESLRSEIVSGSGIEEDKQKLAGKWNQLYRQMVEVHLELHDYTQAIEYVERSKARNLIELLATRDLYPKAKIPETVRHELQRLRQEIDREKLHLASEATPDHTHLYQLRQQYKELYPYEPIRFDQIQNLIDDQTTIIEWYIFADCFRVFIISCHSPQPIIWTSSSQDLENLDSWFPNYVNEYDNYRKAQNQVEPNEWQHQWETSIGDRLQELADILHINHILSHIPKTCDQLILIPHMYLHLLPLHALPISSSNSCDSTLYLLDRFAKGIRYTPSCQLLQSLQQQQNSEFQHLFAIQNPTADLYEEYEKDLGTVGTIKKQFAKSCILKKSQAKKSEILRFDENTKTVTPHQELLAAHCVFFFCHGYFDGYFDLFSPLNSWLQLADEKLTLADIIGHFDLKNCRLVTLAACETGLSNVSLSDEYISLPYGFLLAGSTNVVSSLWTVSATATALLMIKFYEQLMQQNTVAVALNIAQRWLRDTTVQGFQDWLLRSQLSLGWQFELSQYFNKIKGEQGGTAKPFEQPYYWAAFCAIGKGV